MAQGVPRCVQAFQLDGLADLDHIARPYTAVHAADAAGCLVMGNHLGSGGRHHGCVATRVVEVLVGVEQLGDLPAAYFGGCQAFLVIQRIDGQCLAGFRTSDQVVEVAVAVSGPDAFDEHGMFQIG